MKYLRISIAWRNYVASIVSKVDSIKGFICCNFKPCSVNVKHRCYLTLILPMLEYAASNSPLI